MCLQKPSNPIPARLCSRVPRVPYAAPLRGPTAATYRHLLLLVAPQARLSHSLDSLGLHSTPSRPRVTTQHRPDPSQRAAPARANRSAPFACSFPGPCKLAVRIPHNTMPFKHGPAAAPASNQFNCGDYTEYGRPLIGRRHPDILVNPITTGDRAIFLVVLIIFTMQCATDLVAI